MKALARLVRAVPLILLAPVLSFIVALALFTADCLFLLRRRRAFSPDTAPDNTAATVVIPNWNGRDLLEKYIPSVVEALAGNDANEILVVDNASKDGTVEFLRERFPQVTVVALEGNRGFGGGSNEGFRAARNDVVVLLNSDMRVAPDFLAPLLAPFRDPKVFAVTCQIFFSDPGKQRQETGLTQGWWENGQLRVRHRMDDAITEAFPCLYAGGGSSAFDRRKFFELGGFDHLFAPFYLEDTDLGYLAWKRGWKVFYEPRSHVWHEHRGTIGKKFTQEQINEVLNKNYLLWCWKNVHSWRMLLAHFGSTLGGGVFSALFGDAPLRPTIRGLWRAFRQLPQAIASRKRATRVAANSDAEAFRLPLGGYYRDRFQQLAPAPERPRVLFVAPYALYPPVHGGGVFMYQTVVELAKRTDLHLIVMLDWPHELEPHLPIAEVVQSVEYLVRTEFKEKRHEWLVPYAASEFRQPDLAWLIHRQIFLKQIDLLQLEYTPLAQYAGGFRQIPSIVFEHDVYFQSISRGLPFATNLTTRIKSSFEYLRALRFEVSVLPRADRVQVCSRENGEYLASFVPALRGRIDDGYRAGIDTSSYSFRTEGREADTILFLGSFRHLPNQEALDWFLRLVMPRVLERVPGARLKVVGAEPPPAHFVPHYAVPHVDLLGFVDDVRGPLNRYAVFVCPILSGSGVRVKLLEAFAAGIPVVSTLLGAEGLAQVDGEICALADDPAAFADRVVRLLLEPDHATQLARRAREFVVRERDMAVITARLADSYRETIRRMRTGTQDFGVSAGAD